MQQQAVESIEDWFKGEGKAPYFLAGYAGTGKTTLVNYVIDKLKIKLSEVAFACYTGKAALVVTQKAQGKYKASTIHSLIYDTYVDKKTGDLTVKKKSKDMLSHLKLIVVDEASMVDGQIMSDLRSFGVKILFIGDTGQLPPVSQNKNEEFLQMFNNPDFTLTEIHRQAAENPIIYLSMLARTKQKIEPGTYGKNGEAVVITHSTWETMKEHFYEKADQIICGYNRTRKHLNSEIRKFLGYESDFPLEGDKMICLKNDWNKNLDDISLVNGMTGYVSKVYQEDAVSEQLKYDSTVIDFQPDFTGDYFEKLVIPNDSLTDDAFKLQPHEHKIYNSFDYGYVITCHKSQGSQWEKVVVIDEVLDRNMHHRWLYTAITRSTEKLVLVV
ncbi:ATP-dependent DNA helicase [Bacillus paralicheniformis]|uniref:AAA family ATPase n=3 Tax=Bacillus subtilis group TaxID=653685 RepID=A0AB37GLX8_BACLI|nr:MULTISPECIES: AAA family ATPase [Bacillus subtilis group]AMR10743.1 hypothetical protein AB684_11315 [Bacillus licheniformis]AVI45401.1 Exodeoxyribonuclease V [Bacillus licheniformis]KYC83548.1 hypothetical protein B4091_2126 [Bacillus licheniformis]MDE1368163.1 AAA family ATPase [Bacillus licheniformis]MDE1388894.1 AAA family ATPase [Bacillus licheniformis]